MLSDKDIKVTMLAGSAIHFMAELPSSCRSRERESMIRSRVTLVFLFACFVVLASLSAQQESRSLTGWISDEACGIQHSKPGGADCVQKCWRGGASVGHPEWKPQRAVFVADNDQAIWIVENSEAVRAFPAAHVVLNGRFDPAKRMVRVEEVTPATK